MKKVRWFIYTVVVGLIPFLLRGCIFLVMKQKDVNFLFDPIDFIILGLIINISIINDLERNINN